MALLTSPAAPASQLVGAQQPIAQIFKTTAHIVAHLQASTPLPHH